MPYKDPEKQREAERRSQAKRRARMAAEEFDVDNLPEEPSREQLIRLLGMKARRGDVPAIKLLLDRSWEKDDDDSKPAAPLSRIDELAARRVA